ncbi:ASCH domain-containing protein [Psychrobacillus sp. FSL K6-4046]|uniref:ASCH domain-containing protein n=1 Tax=Psychrobacillus sp. FSL K6-4046 TaxID=2921550 RepID=UPI00315B0F7D
MNVAAREYWNSFWKDKEYEPKVSAWQFGEDADTLAQLVVNRIKTATCSAHILYEKENEPLPQVGEYNIILNTKDEPVCIIKTKDVTIKPMNRISEEFAHAEGEGDRSYDYWKKTHINFFTNELDKVGLKFEEDLLLVCERFEVIDVK